MKTKMSQNKTSPRFLKFSVIALALVGSVAVSSSALAASACKGLDNSSCSNNSSCGWVDGYERKDGRKVKAFCRTKSVKKSTVDSRSKKKVKSVASK